MRHTARRARPPSQRRRHLTLLPSQPPPRGATPDTKPTRSRRTPTHMPTGSYAPGHRAQARNRHNRLTQPKLQHESNPSHTPKPLTLDS